MANIYQKSLNIHLYHICSCVDPLKEPVHKPYTDEDMIEINNLLKAGADPNYAVFGKTCLHFVLYYYPQNIQRRCVIVQMLLEAGANPNIISDLMDMDVDRDMFFHMKDINVIISMLIKYGADPNSQTSDRRMTLLFSMMSIMNSDVIIKLLLEKGADPNIQNISGKTALHYACTSASKSRFKTMTLLFLYGANPEIKDNKRKTPRDYLNESEKIKYDKMLLYLQNYDNLLQYTSIEEIVEQLDDINNISKISEFLVDGRRGHKTNKNIRR